MKKALKYLLVPIFLIPVIIYIFRFYGLNYCDDPKHWNEFSNFFNGLYSPIILIFIAFIVERRENDNNESSLQLTKSQEQIKLKSIAFKDLKKITEQLGLEGIVTNASGEMTQIYTKNLNIWITCYRKLFRNQFDKDYLNRQSELITQIQEIFERGTLTSKNKLELSPLYKELLNLSISLLGQIGYEIF